MAACPVLGQPPEEGKMADGFHGATQLRIAQIVHGLLAKRAGAVVGPDQNLTDAGLTSLDMVGLMLAIEDAFEIEIPQRRMTPANFRTIAAIEKLVGSVALAA
jgi:acyl carrier protein